MATVMSSKLRMCIASLIILLTVTSLFALSALQPSIELSAAAFTGRVLSAQKVKVVVKDDSRWELWKAEVRVQTVVTQDVALTPSVFVYYARNCTTSYVTKDKDGQGVLHVHTPICPAMPHLATNSVYKFFCIRNDVEDDKRLLFIPEEGWAIRQ